MRQMSKAALGLGLFLFFKAVTEDLMRIDSAGFLSPNLIQRVVREKIGSGLVLISMVLHLQATLDEPNRRNKTRSASRLDFGMAATVIFRYGLPFVFSMVQKGEIKF